MANTPDPRDFYRVSRVVLMPSLWRESLGRVPIEAMANGIPVLASYREALPETPGDAGFVFTIPDRCTPASSVVPTAQEVAPWVAVIERLWDDPEFVSQEPGMTASFAGARARGSQRGLTTPVPWEKRGRTAPVMRDRCVTRSPRILSCAERGTGLDHREGEISPIRARDHGAVLVALSSLALSISVLFQGVPASHRTGFKTPRKMRFFWIKRPISSHPILLI